MLPHQIFRAKIDSVINAVGVRLIRQVRQVRQWLASAESVDVAGWNCL